MRERSVSLKSSKSTHKLNNKCFLGEKMRENEANKNKKLSPDWSTDWLWSENVAEQLLQVDARVREQVLTLGVLDDGLVAEHVLVTHLHALGSLEPDLVDRVLDLNCLAVLQAIDADIDRAKRAC